mmetsp:Transcript_42541/g.51675  ORF Transcript_42541/g.51675 Transcript_42541/m.51675 type:complete len:303 (-) Transcript_42541:868-1776(-)
MLIVLNVVTRTLIGHRQVAVVAAPCLLVHVHHVVVVVSLSYLHPISAAVLRVLAPTLSTHSLEALLTVVLHHTRTYERVLLAQSLHQHVFSHRRPPICPGALQEAVTVGLLKSESEGAVWGGIWAGACSLHTHVMEPLVTLRVLKLSIFDGEAGFGGIIRFPRVPSWVCQLNRCPICAPSESIPRKLVRTNPIIYSGGLRSHSLHLHLAESENLVIAGDNNKHEATRGLTCKGTTSPCPYGADSGTDLRIFHVVCYAHSDLSTVQTIGAAVTTIPQLHRGNVLLCFKIHPPPGVGFTVCMSA